MYIKDYLVLYLAHRRLEDSGEPMNLVSPPASLADAHTKVWKSGL